MYRKVKLLLWAWSFFLSCACLGAQVSFQQPFARHGVFDLAGWSPAGNQLVNLDGEWEFYWQQLLTPDDFLASAPRQPTGYLAVPGSWLRFFNPANPIKGYGYATLRLKINLKEKALLGLKIPTILTAYKLWVNGQLLNTAGKVGTTASTSRMQTFSTTEYMDIASNELELVLQISNFDDLWGGVNSSFKLGNIKQINKLTENQLLLTFSLVGAIFIFGLYHLGLFIIRKKEQAALFLGLVCLLISFYGFFYGLCYVLNVFPGLDWEIVKKFGFIVMILGSILFLTFTSYLYPRETSAKLLYILNGVNTLFLIFMLFTPFRIYVRALFIFQASLFITSTYVFVILVLALWRKREGSLIHALGYAALFLSTLNDILFTNDIIHTGFTIHFGLFLFVLAQALVIALRFSNLFVQVKRLSDELQLYSSQLELKVKERTLQLEEANQQKTNFFINFCHETKTPLTLILNYLEKDIKQRGLSQDIRLVDYNLKKLKQDMIDFLDLEKLNHGQVFYDHKQVINVSFELKMKILLFKEVVKKKDLTLTSELEENLYIELDSSAWDRILNNLIDNAIKFTPQKGKIHVTLKGTEDKALCTIQDTGRGIPLEEQQKIFEPYYQISSEKRNIQGMGMGLAIVKKIMDDIEGEITLESKPDMGTIFCLTFKRCAKPEHEEVQRLIPEFSPLICSDIILKEETYDKSKPTILIVDDNQHILCYLQSSLEKKYNIFYAANGLEALAKIEGMPEPNLIISDIMMDQLNGYELLKLLSLKDSTRHIPFIFLTAKTNEGDKIDGYKSGAVDYIYKPFLLEELTAKIDALIKQQSRQQEAQLKEIERKLSVFLRSNILALKLDDEEEMNQLADTQLAYDKLKITPKEKQIIDLLAKGFGYKEISAQLNISVNTVKPYINAIYKKLNVHNKVELFNSLQNSSS